MLTYPDRRGRYRSALPGQVPAGNARGDNPVPAPEPKANLAKRGLAPGEHFRETTSLTKPVTEREQITPQVAEEAKKTPNGNIVESPRTATPAPSFGSVLAKDAASVV